MGIIGLIFPSIFGLFCLEKMDKKWELKTKDYVYLLSLLILFSNSIVFVISRIVWNVEYNMVEYLNYYPIFFVKYVIVSLIVNFGLAILFVLVKKYVDINIEVIYCEKK